MSARRRHRTRSAPRARTGSPAAAAAETAVLSRLPVTRRRWVLLGCAATVGLWQLAFAPFDLWPLAYVALLPWALVVVGAGRGSTAMLAGWLTGLAVFAIAVHWLTWITPVGYIAAVLYLSTYWLAAAWLLRGAFRRGRPLWWTLPVAWVALEYLRAHVISGFPWFYLGHTQYANVRLIQVADLAGVYGVSFFVVMVAGLAIDLLARPLGPATRPGPIGMIARLLRVRPVGIVVTLLTAAGMLIYGSFRLSEYENCTRAGLRIAVVQGAFPISLGGRSSGEDMFDFHMDRSGELPLEELDLLVWPETVLPWRFDEDWAGYDEAELIKQTDLSDDARGHIRRLRRQQRELAALLAPADTALLAGGMTVRFVGASGEMEQANSTLLLAPAGAGRLRPIDAERKYDKMHCVPFSEYVPFKKSWPWFHRLLRAFVPESMPQVTAGESVTRFRVGRGRARWSVATPICYEGTFARVCRAMCYQRPGGRSAAPVWLDTLTGAGRPVKVVDCLVNMSNDGWFIAPWGEQEERWASSELDQHLVQYVFRAIENRVPVARAVNTGVSGFIDSCGRIRRVVSDPATGRRKMIAGTATRQVLVDDRVTLYSSIGDLGAQVCLLVVVVGLLVRWWARRNSTKRATA